MSDAAKSKAYVSPSEASTTSWVMTGVVIASPSTGEVKAVMPVFNAYADIKIETFLSFGDASAPDIPAEASARDAPKNDQVIETGANVCIETTTHPEFTKSWRSKLNWLLGLDARDLALMVGLSSLLGAITNMLYGFGAGSDAPQSLLLAIGIAGFVGGRFLSERLRRAENG
ncbi:hypothetical protein V2I84_05300 [Pseudomonas viridiflava]|uniref:hypothetical protein n=1 Tax=Pseudomonas viridiflava TaxID=33069 RepID=UPI002EA9371C|nr:hypothetical protein [Pseudomonas viridiflava]MEE3980871.1 hypothetical protein [Pseudomonas viridiflava]MEE3989605.1 hypothetical protein [Pseudomonas viridiflava]MEE4028151.1 hypothetical protein [Pseudomonas viridiflava]MEE4034315.1 hypothetical protein [Pseudomonas viridiflava]